MNDHAAPAGTARRTRVLNVDDNEAARYAKTRILELAGFAVSEAATGEQALTLARGTAPDLVLLDTKLPDIDGYEVCRTLKADPATASILVLQTSARYVLTSDRLRALNSGADNFLVEPVTEVELVACVRALARLATVERALREADRRKNEFLATLAHELRNPLAPIRNAVEMLERQSWPALSIQARALDALSRQSQRLTGLVEDLMDVARLEEGKLAVTLAPLQARELVMQAGTAATALVATSGQTLDVDLPHPALWIDGDHERLLKILAALLGNAAKYSEPRGRIALRAAAHDGSLLIQVADDGIGIGDADIETIFGLFVQGPHRPERVQDGLGTSLALARAVLKLHNGEIAAYSKGAGQGSVFEVRLPLALLDADAATTLAAAPERPLQLLLVDDNEDATAMLGALLEVKGYTVRIAGNGMTALELVRAARPDIAILDIGLPDIGGHELARRIREETDGRLPIVALSGNASRSDPAAGVFDRLVDKPVGIDELLALIIELTAPAG